MQLNFGMIPITIMQRTEKMDKKLSKEQVAKLLKVISLDEIKSLRNKVI